MEFNKRILSICALPVLLLPILISVAGCSDSGSAKEDPNSTQKRVAAATEMRSYFDKSGGKYDSLSPEDQTKLNALTGGEKKSREAFSHMTLPQAGGG